LRDIGLDENLNIARLLAQILEYILDGIKEQPARAQAVLDSNLPMRVCKNIIEDHILSDGRDLFLAIDNLDVLSNNERTIHAFEEVIASWHELGAYNENWNRLRIAVARKTSMRYSPPRADVGEYIALKDFSTSEIEQLLRR